MRSIADAFNERRFGISQAVAKNIDLRFPSGFPYGRDHWSSVYVSSRWAKRRLPWPCRYRMVCHYAGLCRHTRTISGRQQSWSHFHIFVQRTREGRSFATPPRRAGLCHVIFLHFTIFSFKRLDELVKFLRRYFLYHSSSGNMFLHLSARLSLCFGSIGQDFP